MTQTKTLDELLDEATTNAAAAIMRERLTMKHAVNGIAKNFSSPKEKLDSSLMSSRCAKVSELLEAKLAELRKGAQ